MTQSALGDFDEQGYKGGIRRNAISYPMMSPKSTLDEPSCPWCLHPASEFTDQPDNKPLDKACPNCHTPVPVDEDWYKRGEKIVV